MTLQAFPSGPFETNAYIVFCAVAKVAVVVDPAPESSSAIIDFLAYNQLRARLIILTHSHWDHMADVSILKKKLNIPVAVHPLDAENLRRPGSDQLPCPITIKGVEPDQLLSEGDRIEVGHIVLTVLHTPGHTPGGICLYCPSEEMILTGDTLFKGSIGNLSFPTAKPELMWPSLDRLARLPPQTKVFPGHGESTTIGEERWLPHAKDLFIPKHT